MGFTDKQTGGQTGLKHLLHRENAMKRRLLDTESGFTLVETIIASLILIVIAVGVIGSFTFTAATSRVNSNAVAAKNIAQGYFEQMAIDTFADVNATNYPDIDRNDLNDPAVWLDEAVGIRCSVDFDFKGFGVASSGGSSSLTDSTANWDVNEWAGDTVYIADGAGAGQFVRIASNSDTTLNFESNLFFSTGAGSIYLINNGKTVEITTTWSYRGQEYTQTIESLVINFRGDEDLGF